jgi:hypothetical protein
LIALVAIERAQVCMRGLEARVAHLAFAGPSADRALAAHAAGVFLENVSP